MSFDRDWGAAHGRRRGRVEGGWRRAFEVRAERIRQIEDHALKMLRELNVTSDDDSA
jgi:hypothetical protein